ncbi:hypothetical protein LIS66_16210 [Pseudomonas sp. HN2]|uniref:hypothetical protein n=1 Tax=Pseudomonas TaxID=286 RepID=UPI001D15C255|nr:MULTISPECIES: hypothetical protein [Pseudomonas]UEB93928.1 hypothetical protein LIS66_16210 [Pseudomonas sp. HN2]UST67370.1 hypothetical protein NF674_16050 [Pseudomonas moraviensis]
MAAFDSAFGHGVLTAKTEVAGSLWRRARGQLFLSDKYLQNIGARIDAGQGVRRGGAKAVGQDCFQSKKR